MFKLREISPAILKDRHRLSPQQINSLFGEQVSAECLGEKTAALARVAEFIRITDILASENIYFIPLKGPLLSFKLHCDPTFRHYNDLDILVDNSSIERATKLIVSEGYVSPYYEMPVDEKRRKILRKNICEQYLINQHKGVSVEIHWALFTGNIVPVATLDEVAKTNLTEIDFAGRTFRSFTPEFELLYLVIHGGLHAFRRLKWLVDISNYLEKIRIDDSKFIQLTRQLRAGRLVGVSNTLLRTYLSASRLLPSFSDAPVHMVNFASHQIEMERDEDSKSVWEYLKRSRYVLSSFPGLAYKWSSLKSMMFATDMAADKRIPYFPPIFYLAGPIYKLARGFR